MATVTLIKRQGRELFYDWSKAAEAVSECAGDVRRPAGTPRAGPHHR